MQLVCVPGQSGARTPRVVGHPFASACLSSLHRELQHANSRFCFSSQTLTSAHALTFLQTFKTQHLTPVPAWYLAPLSAEAACVLASAIFFSPLAAPARIPCVQSRRLSILSNTLRSCQPMLEPGSRWTAYSPCAPLPATACVTSTTALPPFLFSLQFPISHAARAALYRLFTTKWRIKFLALVDQFRNQLTKYYCGCATFLAD